jgi:hypothetical protein
VHGVGPGDLGDLEAVEDRAPAVVADDDLQPRRRLTDRQQERPTS